MNINKIIILLFITCTMACSTLKINVPEASFHQSVDYEPADRYVKSVEIVNKASKGEQVFRFLGNSHVPIEPETSTKKTVENDIRSYFEKRLVLSDSATKSLKIKIKKANVYRINGPGDTVPFIGFITVHSYHPYYLYLDVFFEIEENGKVIKSYNFDEKITLEDGKSAYPSDVRESYIRLIELYRNEFFNQLNSEFINRYF